MGIISKTLKILSIISLILVIIISVIGYLALADAKEFSQKTGTESNMFLLVDQGHIIAGERNMMHNESPTPVTLDEMDKYQKLLDNKDYAGLQEDNYKALLFDMNMFYSMADIELEGTGFNKSQIIAVLKTRNATNWMLDMAMSKINVPPELKEQAIVEISKNIPTEAEIRGNLFMMLLGIAGKSRGPAFIIDEYRAGNVKVYPETMMFQFIKYAPQRVIDVVESKMGAGTV
ncbi:MAG: hypothetical protein NT001_07000 [Candidatus Woesearchaeota archaeon]|nr:hypothetical protein [Candidatus Woesearchaeota archaeon]